VEAGFGLALLQESSVNEELRAGTLHALRIPAMLVAIPVVLIHRRRAYLSGAARALMALLTTWPATVLPPRGPARRARRPAASTPRQRLPRDR